MAAASRMIVVTNAGCYDDTFARKLYNGLLVFLLLVFKREAEEVLEEYATVARLVGVRPERAAAGLFAQNALALFGREIGVDAVEVARQVLKRFFEVELDGVDELALVALDHHLVAAAVGCGEQSEAFGHAVKLESVVLPDAQVQSRCRVVVPRAGVALAYVSEDGIVRFGDAYVAVLVFKLAPVASLARLKIVERDATRAERDADELVAAADAEHRDGRPHDEARE